MDTCGENVLVELFRFRPAIVARNLIGLYLSRLYNDPWFNEFVETSNKV